MAEDIKDPNETAAEEIEDTAEVEAHSAEVLGLQELQIPGKTAEDGYNIAMSCTSCVGSVCAS